MFFGKPKPIISAEDNEWQFATFRWLIAEFAAAGEEHRPRLVTPTRDYFPESSPVPVLTC